MAGGEDDEGRVVNKPVFPPYPERPPDPAHLYPNKDPLQTHPPLPPGQPVPPAPIGYVEKPTLEPVYPTAPIPPPQLLPPQAIGDSQVIGDSPVARSDPPATTADDPVDLPPVNDENFGEHMSEVLAKVGQEELVKTGQVKGDAIKVNENLSTDPNMPVFMKRKRGRPRKHPLPEQRRTESTGRRVGRPPKNSNRVNSYTFFWVRNPKLLLGIMWTLRNVFLSPLPSTGLRSSDNIKMALRETWSSQISPNPVFSRQLHQ